MFSLILFLHDQMGAVETDENDADEINDIARIDDTFGDIFKMKIGPHIADDAQQGRRKEKKHFIDSGQNETDDHSHDKSNDLIARQRRGK